VGPVYDISRVVMTRTAPKNPENIAFFGDCAPNTVFS
jgi:hypothetical protein